MFKVQVIVAKIVVKKQKQSCFTRENQLRISNKFVSEFEKKPVKYQTE